MTTQAYKERIIPKDQKIQSTHQEIFDAIVADDRAKFEDLTTDLPQPDISFSIPADDKTHPMLLNKPTIPNLCCLLGAKNILAYVEQQPAFHLDKKDEKGRTCVHFTAATGDLNMLQILLGNDLKLDPLDNDGNNACHYAAKFDNIEIFKYLYMNGIDLNHRNQDGQSPFIWAAANNSCEVLKFIISVQNGKELAGLLNQSTTKIFFHSIYRILFFISLLYACSLCRCYGIT